MDKGPKLGTDSEELFPLSDRCVFRRAPLNQVFCQLQFPQILSIDSAPPAVFQESVRSVFPLLERTNQAALLGPIPPQLLQLINAGLSGQSQYSFLTDTRSTTLGLTSSSISLATAAYSRWEDFWRMLEGPLKAFDEIYKPSFFTRIGLRYTNVLRRDAIGLKEVPWSRLLRREILGELALPQFEKALDRVASRILTLKLPANEGTVVFRHGLANVQGTPPSDSTYMLDFDFFKAARTEIDDAKPALDKFHEYAGHAFRWAISPELYNTLDPTDPVTGAAKPLPFVVNG